MELPIEENSLSFRQATIEDAKRLAHVGKECFCHAFGYLYKKEDLEPFLQDAFSLQAVRNNYAQAHCCYHVACNEAGEIIGFINAGNYTLPVPEPAEDDGVIKQLYVLPAYQSAGAGRVLMHAALEWLKQHGFGNVYLSVWEDNIAAQRLYERFGFKKISEFDFYVGNHIDHEYLMQKCRE